MISFLLLVLAAAATVAVVCVGAKCTTNEWEERWFQQPLDHFSPYWSDARAISQRYLYSDRFCKGACNGAVMYTGNEGDITEFATSAGFMWYLAEEVKAAVVFAECRYYGKSLPPSHLVDASHPFAYLTTEQLLADYARLTSHLQEQHHKNHSNNGNNSTKEYRVVAVGGSYGGMLAARLRQGWPWLVHAAIASSAPVNGFEGMAPPHLIYDVISSNFLCAEEVGKAFRRVWFDMLSSSSSGRDRVAKVLGLCHVPQSPLEAEPLIGWFQAAFTSIATLDYPYAVNFTGLELPAGPAKVACAAFRNASDAHAHDGASEAALHGLLAAARVVVPASSSSSSSSSSLSATAFSPSSSSSTSPTSCLQLEDDIEAYRPGLMPGAWSFQRCSDVVLPSPVDASAPLFLSCSEFAPNCWNNGERFRAYCLRTFGTAPPAHEAAARRVFGGSVGAEAGVGRVIYTNGFLDPWSSGGILSNNNSTEEEEKKKKSGSSRFDGIELVWMRGAAHHLELRSPNDLDPQDVKDARELLRAAVREWFDV